MRHLELVSFAITRGDAWPSWDSKVFSKIYLKSGYWQLPICDRDIPKIAFQTRWYLYELFYNSFWCYQGPIVVHVYDYWLCIRSMLPPWFFPSVSRWHLGILCDVVGFPQTAIINCGCHVWNCALSCCDLQNIVLSLAAANSSPTKDRWRRQKARNALKSQSTHRGTDQKSERQWITQTTSNNSSRPQTDVARSQDHPVTIYNTL